MDLRRQPALDVVRGIAISLVLLFHLHFATGIAALDRVIRPIVEVGWVGVDLFFVLSGFLVGRIILAECVATGGFDRAKFIKRRILRLWPVLFLYLAALVLLGGAKGFALVVPVLLHVQNYAVHVPSHLWSLAVEEQFYLVVALALPWLVTRHGARGVVVALVAVIVASTSLRLLAWSDGVDPRALQWQTQYRADGLALGVLFAWIERYRPTLFSALVRRRARNVALAMLGYAVLVGLGTSALRFGPGLIAADVGSAALILAFHHAATPASTRWLAMLGAVAYPLYIWHPSIGQVGHEIAREVGLKAPSGVFGIAFGTSVLVAALISALIERPFMRLRERPRSAARAAHVTIIDTENYYQ
ncbi:acyltransferase family protein [Sphingomonas oligophenolica]|uniref:Acyltransferase n=1 Tax=Sphingomonas oligophenolica TaxID=301154 RepID=A0A502CR21_9SPHN|nr:acyltransferase [Sphingomonas oligophenolica]TPG15328.1 acyltransferase [Sphingomonas oligophenolica]